MPIYKRKYARPSDIVLDESFYVGLEDGKPYLKKEYHFGYYTQIQLALGLAQVKKCYFIAYTFQGIILCEVPYDNKHFLDVMSKLNDFCE